MADFSDRDVQDYAALKQHLDTQLAHQEANALAIHRGAVALRTIHDRGLWQIDGAQRWETWQPGRRRIGQRQRQKYLNVSHLAEDLVRDTGLGLEAMNEVYLASPVLRPTVIHIHDDLGLPCSAVRAGRLAGDKQLAAGASAKAACDKAIAIALRKAGREEDAEEGQPDRGPRPLDDEVAALNRQIRALGKRMKKVAERVQAEGKGTAPLGLTGELWQQTAQQAEVLLAVDDKAAQEVDFQTNDQQPNDETAQEVDFQEAGAPEAAREEPSTRPIEGPRAEIASFVPVFKALGQARRQHTWIGNVLLMAMIQPDHADLPEWLAQLYEDLGRKRTVPRDLYDRWAERVRTDPLVAMESYRWSGIPDYPQALQLACRGALPEGLRDAILRELLRIHQSAAGAGPEESGREAASGA